MLHPSSKDVVRLVTLLLALLSGCSKSTADTSDSFRSTSQSLSSNDEGTWSATGRMAAARLLHSATRLPDGRVLVLGGYNRSTQIYDPATEVWSPAPDALNTYRRATATLLSSGQVLVAGAGGSEWNSGISASLYDPGSGSWAATGNLAIPRFHHSSTLLRDGRVLVVGGADSEYGGNVLAQAELYDPTPGTWSPVTALASARRNHTATLLSDGKVLIAGGTNSSGERQSSAEVYDPSTGQWSAVANMNVPRAYHSATLLADGRVLVAGGGGSDQASSSSAEVFDPGDGSWTSIASMATPRRYHSATLLSSGQVLVTGGFHEYTGILTAAETYDPDTGSWHAAGAMATTRYLHTATLLASGKVLVAGGFSTGDQASCELYTPPLTAPQSPTEPSGTSLLLEVVATSGAPVPTAVVSAQDALFPTDSSGHILFENLPSGRFVARIDALGFTSASAVVELEEGAHVGTRVKLHPLPAGTTFQVEQGGLIETEQVRVAIPPNAIVDALGQPVTGPVQVTITPLDPTSQLDTMPGPLEGVRSAHGDIVSLESFYMADVSLWSHGAPVQLAPGASATLEFLLPDAVSGRFQAGETVPAWWFDLDAGRWREEGAGTVQPSTTHPGKLAWVAQVQHFTWWNCDAAFPDRSCVDVRVVNRSGLPVRHVPVTAEGVSYAGLSGPVYTGTTGHTCIQIMPGNTARIFAGLPGEPMSIAKMVTGTTEPSACGGDTCPQITLALKAPICTPGAYQECLYSGPAGTEGRGACHAGRQQCNEFGMAWSACEGQVTPQDESCTTPFDDNCDGEINETCSCSDREGLPCYSGAAATQGVGICHGGTVGCDMFGNAACVGQQRPRPEDCSTLEDDDCDGSNECTPVTPWTKDVGATGDEEARDLAVDREGNAVLVGAPDGSIQLGDTLITGDTSDLFVSKFSNAGQPLWSRLIERDAVAPLSFGDGDARVTTDGAGNVLIAGSFRGALRIGGATLTSAGDNSSGFVLKLSPTGNVLWAQGFDGRLGGAWAQAVATAPNGDVLVTGSFHHLIRIGDTEYVGGTEYGTNLFVVRLDGNTGAPLWNRRYWSIEQADLPGVSVDAAQRVWVTGTFISRVNLGEVVLDAPRMKTAFIAKLDGVTGATLKGEHMNTPYFYGRRVQVDPAGNVLLLGWTDHGTDGLSHAILWKLNANGGQLWSRTLPQAGPFIHPLMSLAVDTSGRPLIAGWFVPPETYRPHSFLTWYGANGEKLLAMRLDDQNPSDGIGTSQGRAAGIDTDGNILFAGQFWGTMDFGSGPVQAEGSDIFLLKIDPTP